MALTRLCVSCHKYRQTILCLILFAIAIAFTPQGRAISSFTELSQQKDLRESESVTVVAKPQIGSRPPRCEKRCSTCGHCEAVQVPVSPQTQSHIRHYSSVKASRVVTSSRSDDLSNYKPMSWKCKCGDYLLNP